MRPQRSTPRYYLTTWIAGRGNVYIHRHVMEQILGRPLARTEHVHHINEDIHDNRPENLTVLGGREHGRLHVHQLQQWWAAHPDAGSGAAHWSRRFPERTARGVRNGGAKATTADVLEMRQLWARGLATTGEIERIYRLGHTQVWRILRQYNWSHI